MDIATENDYNEMCKTITPEIVENEYKVDNTPYFIKIKYYDGEIHPQFISSLDWFARKINKNILVLDWTDNKTPEYTSDHQKICGKDNLFYIYLPNNFIIPSGKKAILKTDNIDIAIYKEQMNKIKDEDDVSNSRNIYCDWFTKDIIDEDKKITRSVCFKLGDNYIKCYTSLFFKSTDPNLSNHYLQSIYEKVLTMQNNKLLELAKQIALNQFSFLETSFLSRTNTLHSNIKESLERMRLSYKTIAEKEREISDFKIQLEANDFMTTTLDQKRIDDMKNIVNGYNFLLKYKYSSITFDSIARCLFGDTKLIKINYTMKGETNTYILGNYRIIFGINDFGVKITRLQGRINTLFDHPHILEGIPCLGNLKEIVPKLMAAGEYTELFNVMYDFVSTINPYGQYNAGKISNWPVEKTTIVPQIDLEPEEEDDEDDNGDTQEEHAEDTNQDNIPDINLTIDPLPF